jgi:autotransporter-associated beta strand protein
MKTPNTRKLLVSSLLAQMALVCPAFAAAVTWDAGGADTNTSTGLNWNPDGVPTFGSTLQATMTTGGTASVDNAMTFGPTTTVPAVQFGGNFTLNDGTGSLTLYGTNSGGQYVLRSNSAASAVTINAPIKVFATSPVASPLGNLLVIGVNNTTASNQGINITGGISLAAGSTASSYDIRFANGSGGSTGAAARIAGAVSGLGTVTNGSGVWNGKLIFAGSQTLGSSNISISSGSGFGNPVANAQVVLGESSSDVQTWNNVTLNNVMTVAIGGTVSVNAISGSTTTGKVVGTGASGATLKITSGTLNSANIAVGGSTTAEKSLDIVKQNAGTLTVSGAHTYTGSTAVNGGTLALSSGTTLATSGITVNDGGTLSNAAAGITAPITVNAGGTISGEGNSGALSFGNGTSTFNFDPATQTSGFTAASYSANSNALVLLTPSASTTIGTPYLVLTSTAGFGSSVPSEFAASARGVLALAGGNTQINFTPTAAASLTWKGNVSGNWDVVNSLNWINGLSADRFYASDAVSFDDTATTGTISVANSGVSAGSVSFSNSSLAYALGGAGGIASTGVLSKSDSGSVTIGNTVSATGVTVSGGSLALNAAVNIGAGDITVGGGSLTLGAANTATGAININTGGTLTAGITGALGSTSNRTVSLDGGTLNYNGAGTISSDTLNLSVAGNSAVGVGNAAVTVRVGGTFSGAGNLTVSGPGVLALGKNGVDATWGSGFGGNITVGDGAILSLRNPQSLGDTSGTTTIQNGGTLMVDPFSQATLALASESLAFQGNSTLSTRLNGQGSLAVSFSGPISTAGVLGVNTVNSAASGIVPTTTFDGVISGSGGVSFGTASTYSAGAATAIDGLYVLNAANDYTGPTTLLKGTVRLGGNERISNASTLVMGGGTLDLNGFSETFGALDLNANASFALGASNSISFANSSSQDWGSFTLNFTSLGGSFVANSVRFGTSSSGLTLGQLSQITVDGIGGYSLDGSGYLTAVPEPSAYAVLVGAGVLGAALLRRRRRPDAK